MPEIFKGGFTVSNNNGSKSTGQKPSVIVRNEHRTILARVDSDRGKLLERIRAKVLSEEWSSLVRQLIAAQVPPEVIDDIVKAEGAVKMYKRQNTLCEVLCCMQELIDYADGSVAMTKEDLTYKLSMVKRAKLAMENVRLSPCLSLI